MNPIQGMLDHPGIIRQVFQVIHVDIRQSEHAPLLDLAGNGLFNYLFQETDILTGNFIPSSLLPGNKGLAGQC